MKLIGVQLECVAIIVLQGCTKAEKTPLLPMPSPDAGVLVTAVDAGQKEPPSKFKLEGPWDSVEFRQNNNFDCRLTDGVRTAFPPLIGGDWDTAGLQEIPADYIIDLTDTALRFGDHGPVGCAFEFFKYFAQNDAYYLESDCTEDGTIAAHDYERSLFTAAMIGLPLLKVRADALVPTSDWEAIRPWIRKLMSCHQVMLKDRTSDNYIRDFGGFHNSVYNVSLAGLSFAIVLDDKDAFVEFAQGLRLALDTLNDTGTSNYEINEKREATLYYHNYIANYATHAALLTDMNDRDLLSHDKLRKLRKLVVDDLAGADTLKTITGIDQTRLPTDEPWNLTWTYHVSRIDKDAQVRAISDQYESELVHTMTSGQPDKWWIENTWLDKEHGMP